MDEKELKKALKIFAKYTKAIRPDGITIIKDDKTIISAVIDSDYVQPVATTVLFNDDIVQCIPKFTSEFINSKELNRILSGTGVEIKELDNKLVGVLSKNKGGWKPSYNEIASKNILNYYNRVCISANSCTKNNSKVYEVEDWKIKLLCNKFLCNDYELIDGVNVGLKFTNRMFPNVDKETTKLTVQILNNADVNKSEDELGLEDYMSVLKTVTYNKYCTTISYFPFLLLYL